MSAAASQPSGVFGAGGIALSHWELVALLRLLRVQSIPGLAEDGIESASHPVAPETARAKLEAAADALVARGLASATQATDGERKTTLVIATPLLALLAVCASCQYSIHISSLAKQERIDYYLHAWMGLGAVHAIVPNQGLHIFLPVKGKGDLPNAARELTTPIGVALAPTATNLGSIPAQALQSAVRAASEGGAQRAQLAEQRLAGASLSADHQRNFARALATAYRFDDIEIGYMGQNNARQQATALLITSESGIYFCYRGYGSDAAFTVLIPDARSIEQWLKPLIPTPAR